MSAHFIPFTEHDKDNSDAWFGGISGYLAVIRFPVSILKK